VLKITITETATERRWVVEGRLVGLWVTELRTIWQRTRRREDGRASIIDLNGVTVIDSGGQAALVTMIRQGAQLTARTLYGGYLVEQLVNKARHAGASRPKRKGESR
jgi:ABC-type transporter Mla MlaB component